MKKLLILSVTFLVASCDGSAVNSYDQRIHKDKIEQEAAYTETLQRSEKLKDCVYEYVDCQDCRHLLNVIRCPQSTTTTTTQQGKTEVSITVDSPATTPK